MNLHPAMRQLMAYLQPHRYLFSFSCGSSVLNKVLDLMPPLLVGWVIDSVRREPPAWIVWVLGTVEPWSLAIFLAFLAVVIFAFEGFFEWGYKYGFMILAQKVQHQMRMDAYNHIQRREIEFFENHRMGETMAMLNDDVNQIEHFLNIGYNKILQLFVVFIFAGVVLIGVSWELALIGLIPLPIIVWGSLRYQDYIAPRYRRIREAVGSLSSRLENNISGILVIKSFTAERFESARVNEASYEYQQSNYHAILLSALYVPTIRMAVALGFAGVLLVGSYWVLADSGILSVGELVLFSMMIQRILWPLTDMGVTLDEYERAKASASRTFGLLQTPSRIQNPANPQMLPIPVQGEIKLQQVSFQYAQSNMILRQLDLTLHPAQTVGVAGTTGSGKSTLIKMLLRLYDPNEGQILFDGRDLRDLALQDLRQHIALVSQDTYLFHGTIRENIAYGLADSHFEKIEEASKQAQLHDFVMTLPNGYETIVGERGILLSGGQRQRLSIARAILKNAPVMIFDEATSAVDTETERAIQQNLEKITLGKTALVIAHRLSTIRHADRIIVLSQGQIAEDGTHDELLKLNGTYADLWKIQSGNAKSNH